MKEFWRRYGFSKYEVSTEGNIRKMAYRDDKGRIIEYPKMITKYRNKHGVYCVNIEIGGKKTVRTVHKMVAEVFIKNTYKSKHATFKDGNKENLSRKNIRWQKIGEVGPKRSKSVTVNQNYPRGESHWRFKSGSGLSDVDIEGIRASTRTPTEIARDYGITRAYVYQIKKGEARQYRSLDSIDAKKNLQKYDYEKIVNKD